MPKRKRRRRPLRYWGLSDRQIERLSPIPRFLARLLEMLLTGRPPRERLDRSFLLPPLTRRSAVTQAEFTQSGADDF